METDKLTEAPTVNNKKPNRIRNRKAHTNDRRYRNKPAMESNLRAHIKSKGTFEVQLQELIDSVQITRNKYERLEILYADLQRVLDEIFPGCIILPFGSVIPGLAFENSDVDCFVFLPPELRERLLFEFQGDDDRLQKQLVLQTKSKLYRNRNIFTDIVPIPRASVPIVKFLHTPTNISCDVSFKNGFGVHNTTLIHFLVKSDDRLKPLILFIKYWAKKYSLSGRGAFTSYALTMMIIFYLQQISPPILVPIVELQRDPRFEIIIDGWNCGYNYAQPLPPNRNNLTILQLLQGFFEFYSDFEFAERVICPYSGTVYDKKYFDDLNNLWPLYGTYLNRLKSDEFKHITATPRMAYIQDPFEHCRNIVSCVSFDRLKQFKQYCKLSLSIIDEAIRKNDSRNVMDALLQQPVPQQKRPKNHARFEPGVLNIDLKPLKIPEGHRLIDDLKVVMEKVCGQVLGSRYNLIADCDRTEGDKSFHELKYKCDVFRNVWHSRNKYFKTITIPNLLLKEIEVTNVMLKDSKERFMFTIHLVLRVYGDSIEVEFKHWNGHRGDFKQCYFFLIHRFQNIITANIFIPKVSS